MQRDVMYFECNIVEKEKNLVLGIGCWLVFEMWVLQSKVYSDERKKIYMDELLTPR